jgi:8-oxo-dGTP diphosphatase
MWEFVGGKKESGESYQQALKRELQEELGIEVAVGDLAVDTIYSYPDLDVHLNLFNCQIIAGQPRLLEHQDLRWISRQETADYQFCPADRQLLQLLFKD